MAITIEESTLKRMIKATVQHTEGMDVIVESVGEGRVIDDTSTIFWAKLKQSNAPSAALVFERCFVVTAADANGAQIRYAEDKDRPLKRNAIMPKFDDVTSEVMTESSKCANARPITDEDKVTLNILTRSYTVVHFHNTPIVVSMGYRVVDDDTAIVAARCVGLNPGISPGFTKPHFIEIAFVRDENRPTLWRISRVDGVLRTGTQDYLGEFTWDLGKYWDFPSAVANEETFKRPIEKEFTDYV